MFFKKIQTTRSACRIKCTIYGEREREREREPEMKHGRKQNQVFALRIQSFKQGKVAFFEAKIEGFFFFLFNGCE
jgi:hypothetical protein